MAGMVFGASLGSISAAKAATSPNDGFDPNANGNVNSIVIQPDGKILMGGYFTQLQPFGQPATSTPYIARVNHDGTVDTNFSPAANDVVRTVVLQSNGQILLGGNFSAITPTGSATAATRNFAARLNSDGSLDSAFNPNPNGVVYAMAWQPNGQVIIGGAFTTVQPPGAPAPIARNHVARFNADGSLDTTFDPSPDKTVLALAVQPNDQILIGGGFSKLTPNGASSSTPRSCMARVNSDGSLDTGFDPEPNGSVDAILVLPSDQIIIGGEFVTVQPNGAPATTQADFLARLNPDGTLDTSYIINPLQAVSAVAVQPDGKLLIGGTFLQVYPVESLGAVTTQYVARINTDGSVDSSFVPSPNQAVSTIAVQSDGNVLLGGYFTNVQPADTGVPTLRNHVVRLNTYGVPDSSIAPDAAGTVFATAALSNGQTLVGGSFLSIGGATASFLGRLNADGSLDASFKATVNGPVQAISVQSNGQILIGGSFTNVDGIGRGNVARLNPDGTLDGAFNPNANSNVVAIAQLPNNQILIGGNFSLLAPNGSTTGYSVSNLARINSDGSLDLTFNPAPNGSVYTIVIDGDGKILIGGGFTAIGSAGRSYAARILSSGAIDPVPFDPEPNQPVYAIAIQADKKILIGGTFSAVVPQTAKAGKATTAYNYPTGPQTVLPAPGASATTPIYINHLARINTDGSLDTSFFPDPDSDVLSIGVQSNGAIVVGGTLTSFAPNGGTVGTIRRYIGRLNSDGSLDQSFNPNANLLVQSVTVLSNQNILVGGAFTTLQPTGASTPTYANHVAILNPDGSVNSAFKAGSNSTVTGQVRAFAQQPNGPIIIGGSFSPIAGSPAAYLTRLNGDASLDPSYNSGVDGPVNAVAVLPTGAATSTPSNSAVWLNSNGLVRYSYSAASNGEVVCSAVDGQGRVLIGGLFTSFGGVTGLQNLVRLNTDGTVDTTFNPTPNQVVNAILVQPDGKIVIGGGFTNVDGTNNAYLARLNPDGTLETAFAPQPNLEVLAIARQSDGKLIVGGDFTQMTPAGVTAVALNYISRINSDGTVDSTYNPDFNGPAYSIGFNSKGQAIVGGSFSTVTPNAGSTVYNVQNLVRLNSDGTVDTGFYPDPNAAVVGVIVLPNDQVLAAGTFTAWEQNANVTGVTAGTPVLSNFLSRINTDGTVDTSFAPNPNGGLVTITRQPNGQIILGGNFTTLQPNSQGIASNRSDIARINADGTIDPSFDPSLNGDADTISVLPDGSLFVGGNFTSVQVGGAVLIGGAFANVGGQADTNLARLNADGTFDSSFLATTDGPVNAIAPLMSGESLVGGSFTRVGGQSQPNLALINPAGTLDTAFAPAVSGTVNSIAVQANGQAIIGGSFTTVGGQGHANIARLTAAGALDTSFAASVNGTVNAIVAEPNGKVLIGGSFTSVDGQAMAYLARVNADGSLDGSFNPAPSAPVNAVVLTVDGTIYVGGSFTMIGGQAIPYAAHLTAAGVVDPAFQPDPNGAVSAVMVQPDGKVLLGGSFTATGGIERVEVARFAALSPVASSVSASTDQTTFTWTRTGSAPVFSAVRFEETTDGTHWSTIGQATTSDGVTWQLTGAAPTGSTLVLVRATGIEPSTQFGSAGIVQQLYLANSTATPQVNSSPVLTVTNGVAVNFTVTATQSPKTFTASGLPAGLTINRNTGVISGTPTGTGTYNVAVTVGNAGGSTVSALTITVAANNGTRFSPAATSAANRLLNLSSRADLSGSGMLITGFAISGTGTKTVLLRAVGPGLKQFEVPGTMATPTLQLFASDGTLISQNSGWGGAAPLAASFAQVGAFPLTAGSADSVILTDLSPGSYTVHVFDPSGKGGVVLAEVYDASPSPMTATQRLINISSRGTVSPGAGALIGGFVVTGTSVKSVLVRGVGPGLKAFGVGDALSDPVLSVFDENGNVVAQNLGWSSQAITGADQASITAQDITDVGTGVGAFTLAAGSGDTALIANLPPGSYTFQVTSSSNATGEALGEVYEIP